MISHPLYFFWWVYYIVVFFFCFKRISFYRNRIDCIQVRHLYLALIVFGIFNSINGDYVNYQRYLLDMETYSGVDSIEYVYYLIAYFFDFDNILFRFALIFPSFIGVFYLIRKYSPNEQFTLLLFVCFYWMTFSSAIRSSVSDVIFFIGLFLLIQRRTTTRILISIVFIAISLIFHKSTFLLLPSLILSFIPLKAKSVKIILLFLPVWILIENIILNYAVGLEVFEGNAYLSGDDIEDHNPKIVFINIIKRIATILLVCINLYVNKGLLLSNISYKRYLYRFMFISFIIYLAMIFMPTSNYLPHRYLVHLAIPNMLLFSYITTIHKSSRYYIFFKSLLLIIFLAENIGILRRYMDYDVIQQRLY